MTRASCSVSRSMRHGTLVLWLLVLAFVGAFAAQVATRVRLIAAAPNTFSLDHLGVRVSAVPRRRRRCSARRSASGRSPASPTRSCSGASSPSAATRPSEFLARPRHRRSHRHARWFHAYRVVLTPFAVAVLAGIVYLLIRRAFVRPVALGDDVSVESIVIGLFIATLMVTFLLTWRLDEASPAGRVNWWIARARHPGVPGADPGVEALSSGAVADHRVPEVAGARQPAEPRFREGAGRARDRQGSRQQDRARRVHLRRVRTLPGELPGVGRGEGAQPEDAHPADAGRAARRASARRSSARSTSEKVLWQCTTCGACENQCPVGIEHLPLIIGVAARAGVERRRARVSRRRCTTTSSAAATSGASATTSARSSSSRPALEIFDPARHDVLVWLGCAGAFEADFQKSLRSLFEILRAPQRALRRARRRSAAPAIRPSGPATSTCTRSWPTANIEELKAAGPKKILTSCPALREDDRRRLPEVRLRGRDRALGGVRRGADARASRRRGRGRGHGHVSTIPAISAATAARSTSRASCSTRFGADDRGAGAQPRQPVLLRRRRRAAVRRQGRGAGRAHQRRPVQAAAGHRREHGRHRLSRSARSC